MKSKSAAKRPPRVYTYYRPDGQAASVPVLNHPDDRKDHKPPQKERRWPKRLLIGFLCLLLLFLLSFGWVSWKFFNNSTKIFGGSAIGNALQMIQPAEFGENGTNVLVIGNSVDDPGHPASDLTDSIMIAHANPSTKQVYLISIPRDLWVEIPGVGHRKINEAYHWGNEDGFSEPGLPANGVGLLQKVVETNFGLDINYYLLVNYTALKNVVNTLGGVDITIQSTDPRGLFDPNIQASDGGPLQLANGPQHLDGQTALNLARARGDPAPDGRVAYGFAGSDFTRTEHQRQLLIAIQKKLLTPGVLFNPFKLGHVFDGLAGNISTDMKINEARKLANAWRKASATTPIGLNTKEQSYLGSYRTPTGQSALIPLAGVDDFSAIQSYLRSLTGSQ